MKQISPHASRDYAGTADMGGPAGTFMSSPASGTENSDLSFPYSAVMRG